MKGSFQNKNFRRRADGSKELASFMHPILFRTHGGDNRGDPFHFKVDRLVLTGFFLQAGRG